MSRKRQITETAPYLEIYETRSPLTKHSSVVNSSQVLIPTIAKKLSRSTFNLICSHVVIKSKGVFLKKEDFWRVSGNLARLFTNRLGIGMTWTCLGIFFEGSFPPSFKHSLAKKSINLQPHHRELNEERKIIKKGAGHFFKDS